MSVTLRQPTTDATLKLVFEAVELIGAGAMRDCLHRMHETARLWYAPFSERGEKERQEREGAHLTEYVEKRRSIVAGKHSLVLPSLPTTYTNVGTKRRPRRANDWFDVPRNFRRQTSANSSLTPHQPYAGWFIVIIPSTISWLFQIRSSSIMALTLL